MRTGISLVCCSLLGVVLLAGRAAEERCQLTISLVDAESGKTLPGLLQIETADGNRFAPDELLSRGLGIEAMGIKGDAPIRHWGVLPGKKILSVPRSRLTFQALSGLETKLATQAVDLTGKAQAELTISLGRFYRPATQGYAAGNTHLHLMKLNREQADRYLVEIPQADGLEVLFLSYLERADADKDYISNRYTRADLETLSKQAGLLFGNGEEHRHNFTDQGQGYGHVMLLDIKELVQPVSIGPGIMKMGTDGLPIQRGIDTARKAGSTIIWCHNSWGEESIPNWVTGRLHAQNIFDGGTHGSYKDSFYRYLNAGLRVPFSTGTDWFLYDFSRVYVAVDGPLSIKSWLAGLTRGQNYITNGPFLEFQVNGQTLGDTVKLPQAGPVEIVARGLGRVDFTRLEVIPNGTVIQTAATRAADGYFVAEMRFAHQVSAPGWLALRTQPPPVKTDPELQAAVPLNEFGQPLFSHTSPIYLEVGGRRGFNPAAAQELLAKMEHSSQTIQQTAIFADDQERARVLEVYADGIAALRKQISELDSKF